MRILIVTPAKLGSQTGNRITAERWQRFFCDLGHRCQVATEFADQSCDLLIALHAGRSAASIAEFHKRRPQAPIVIVMTGTDLYRDIHTDPVARGSLDWATQLVVLNSEGVKELPAQFRARTQVIVQSVDLPNPAALPASGPPANCWQVVVIGHLRPVKDPMRAARAAGLLPASSNIRIVHVGRAMTAEAKNIANREMARNDRYQWLGELSHPDTLKVLAASNLHVLSSTMEGGANALCEATACGIPSLCSRIAGSVGILGAEYPGYFPVGDTHALAELLYRAENDLEFYQALRTHCLQRASLFAPDVERDALRRLLILTTAPC